MDGFVAMNIKTLPVHNALLGCLINLCGRSTLLHSDIASCNVIKYRGCKSALSYKQGDKKDAIIKEFSREDSKEYVTTDVYQIGDVIYHTKWDDIGIVLSKETTSNGGHAIIVQFEKIKEKKLIENML